MEMNKGVNYLYYLQKKYKSELSSLLFCQNSCPYPDIKEKFKNDEKNVRERILTVTSYIEKYERGQNELVKLKAIYSVLELDIENNRNDERLELDIQKAITMRNIKDAEWYNMVTCTTDLMICALTELASKVDN